MTATRSPDDDSTLSEVARRVGRGEGIILLIEETRDPGRHRVESCGARARVW